MSLSAKYQQLQDSFAGFDAVAIAYSGGVDSALLLKVACDCLGASKVLALTATSPILPDYEKKYGQLLVAKLGAKQHFIASNDLTISDFVENGENRCYHCKHNIFTLFLQFIDPPYILLDGSNFDDLSTLRPGRKALQQLAIRSPLQETQLTKVEVRELSHQLGLSTWDKPSFTCLATRFPHGTKITVAGLQQVGNCENWLRLHDFTNYRVRYHERLARIEVDQTEIDRLLNTSLRLELVDTFKLNGFDYVTLDLQGYRVT